MSQPSIADLQQILANAPEDAKANEQMGLRLMADNQQTAGAVYLEKALKADPNRITALLELAQFYGGAGLQPARAVPLINKAIQIAPNLPVAHIIQGTIHQNQGELPQAVAAYKKGLSLQAEHSPKPRQRQESRASFNQPETERLLWQTLGQLAQAGIHAFPMAGTLLGLTREGHLLPHDDDLDFGLPWQELTKAESILKRNGWLQTLQERGLSNPKSYVHIQSQIQLDLFGFIPSPDGQNALTGMWRDDIPKSWNRYAKFPKMQLAKARSRSGSPHWQLKNPQAWLEAEYGPDWQIPDPHFDTTACSYATQGFTYMTQCYSYFRLYQSWRQGEIEKSIQICQFIQSKQPKEIWLKDIAKKLK